MDELRTCRHCGHIAAFNELFAHGYCLECWAKHEAGQLPLDNCTGCAPWAERPVR